MGRNNDSGFPRIHMRNGVVTPAKIQRRDISGSNYNRVVASLIGKATSSC